MKESKKQFLAEFFAELSIDGGNSTVVFDDPVNSLDHQIIEEVAKRLISFSKIRQTVIFTHSILLFNSLLSEMQFDFNKPIQKKFYSTENQYDTCGVISTFDEKINSVQTYIRPLEKLINNTPKDRPEKDVVAEGYGYLRASIEATVEQEILKNTVKRYQKNVALSNFSKLSGIEIDNCKESLYALFETCCKYISAHSNPEEVASSPNMNQLKIDFEAYKKIRKAFLG